MKKFEFSLQPVLNLREQEEKSARIELGKRTAECDRIRQKMHFHVTLLDRFEKETTRETDWTAYQETADFVRSQNLKLTSTLREAETRRAEASVAYREALNRKKIFEKLKERQAEEYEHRRREKENKILDDLFSSRETYNRSFKK